MKRFKILAYNNEHLESLFDDYKKDMAVVTNGKHIKEFENVSGNTFVVITDDKKMFDIL